MKKKAVVFFIIVSVTAIILIAGCSREENVESEQNTEVSESTNNNEETVTEDQSAVSLSSSITQLEDGFSAVKYDGDYGFDDFLSQGGASSDSDVIDFLTDNLLTGVNDIEMKEHGFGCSTLSVSSPEGGYLFGRNFDWQNCNALVVSAKPKNGYASISTVNMDFINTGTRHGTSQMSSEILALIALYAPLDGMNEQGLCLSVNMIQDSATINQDTEKPDITTTTAIRLLLDKAANVEEAIDLLEQYDLHSSMGMMVHFALADSTGKSVVVEYVDNKIIVIDTPIVTNFYLTQGEKYGIGTSQSHTRYEILSNQLEMTPSMNIDEVRDALDSVSKDNFGEFESTEWSIIFDQNSKEAYYYHRENYDKYYLFKLEE